MGSLYTILTGVGGHGLKECNREIAIVMKDPEKK